MTSDMQPRAPRRVLTGVGLTLLGVVMVAAGAWGVLAIAIAGPGADTMRTALAGAFGTLSLGALVALWVRAWRWRALAAHAAAFLALLGWWQTVAPSNERDWQQDVAILPHATVEGDVFTVHNIRNFDYRSETDYTPAYYDKRFDLAKLEGVELVSVYWMGPAIAHIFVSFAFAGGDHLSISIETRKEKGEGYSTLKGFFRQYEVIYVVADERDVVRLRTNYRKDPPEQVYIYRLRGPLENGRRLFRNYIEEINSLKAQPKFYNTLTTNCTTNIWLHARTNPGHLDFSWKVLASGYVPEYLYETGRLDNRRSFAELQRLAHVNARAQAADEAADFSRRIRDPASPGVSEGTGLVPSPRALLPADGKHRPIGSAP
jgi:hypothetical protein